MIELLNYSNEQAERRLIAWMFSEEDFINVPEEYFYNTISQGIYKFFKAEYLKYGKFDPLSVALNDKFSTYIAESTELSTPAKPDLIIKKLYVAYMIRIFYKTVENSTKKIKEDKDCINDELLKINKKTEKLLLEFEDSPYKHGNSVMDYISKIDKYRKGELKKGYDSPIGRLDYVINGWQRGKVYLVSGLEKLGKSRFLRSMLSYWLNDGYGCILFMLEQSEHDIHESILANRAGVNTNVIGTKNLPDESFKRLNMESQAYINQPFYISNKRRIDPLYIKKVIQTQKIKFKKKGHELVFVAIDFIQNMHGLGEGLHEQSQYIAIELAAIAAEENICLIEISQLTSEAGRTKSKEMHNYIRYGKVFKEAADCIITLTDSTTSKKKKKGDEADDFEVPEEKDYIKLIAHVIQREGLSNIRIPIIAQLQYSSFKTGEN